MQDIGFGMTEIRRDQPLKGSHLGSSGVAGRLIELRTRLSMTPDGVCDALLACARRKISENERRLSTTIYKMWEADKVKPDLEKIELLACVFRTTPEWLAFGVGSSP